MKPYQEGDSGEAPCFHCYRVVTTTYRYRDVPFKDENVIAKAILVGVCDTCCQVVEYPAQSIQAISQALKLGGQAGGDRLADDSEGGN